MNGSLPITNICNNFFDKTYLFLYALLDTCRLRNTGQGGPSVSLGAGLEEPKALYIFQSWQSVLKRYVYNFSLKISKLFPISNQHYSFMVFLFSFCLCVFLCYLLSFFVVFVCFCLLCVFLFVFCCCCYVFFLLLRLRIEFSQSTVSGVT